MPRIIETTTRVIPTPWGAFELKNSFDTSWEVSPRINGALLLRSNPMVRNRMQHDVKVYSRKGFDHTSRNAIGPMATFGSSQLSRLTRGVENIALAKFRGKLYKGSAALGVTVASWRQSAEMIHTRYRMLTARADYWSKALSYSKDDVRATRRRERQIAGMHLEIIFGWTPLLEDIHAAAYSIISSDLSDEWIQVASSHSGTDHRRWSLYEGNNVTASYRSEVAYRVKVAAQVRIDNPNTWLRERAGLNNPATVIWDIVPWSFVVNMFVNTGQLVQSITDYAGLSFREQSTTTSLRSGYTITRTDGANIASSDAGVTSHKKREIGTVPSPSLVFRIPEVNAGAIAMAASLFTQKFSSLARLVNYSKRAAEKVAHRPG